MTEKLFKKTVGIKIGLNVVSERGLPVFYVTINTFCQC